MSKHAFGANWVGQNQQTEGLHFPWPLPPSTFHAQTKNISFTYPFGWYTGINVWPTYGGLANGAEFGFVSVNGWQTDPNSPIGIWFFVGGVPMPSSCYTEVKLVSVVSSAAVQITGLTQKAYYCETITSPAYDGGKFIANFGLVSPHVTITKGRFSIVEYLACHPSADNWFVYDSASPSHASFQFGGHTFGLIPAESAQAFATEQAAKDFFATSDYAQAKQIILSTKVGP